jgi:hypothetical protein
MINIDELTLGQIKQLKGLLGDECITTPSASGLIGKKVIVRTYAAGVHFGELSEKEGKEVILKNARRLWYWKTTNSGISLSEVANAGLHKDSKTCAAVDSIWLEAVEIIPCTKEAIENIEGQNDHKA